MKRPLKAILIILLLIIVASVAVAYWQRDNILALINGTKYSSEEIESQLDDTKENLKAELQKYTSADITDISAEDEKKLLNGEITLEEISKKYNLPLEVIKNGITSLDDKGTSGNSNVNSDTSSNSDVNADNAKAIDDAISDGVSKMYALKAMYVAKLGEVERKVAAEYKALPKEKQNSDGKKEIIMNNIDHVVKIEQNCDDEVAYVLSNLRSDLKKLNGDTEIIQILQDAYEKEKEIKKSYYLSLYSN